jgi:cellulose synthase operon protein YhjQ
MPVVCFASPKGGVGKTTLTATVAVALHRLGWRVLAIDFDRQNALHLHFELPVEGVPGIADAVESGRDWTELVVETRAGIYLIPFGGVSAAGCLRVQSYVGQNPGWIRGQLEPFFEHRDVVVVADMPPGPSPYNVEVDPVTDLQMVVLLADAVSLALVPKLQNGDYLTDSTAERLAQTGYVLNQIEPQRQLCSDVIALSQDALGPDLFGQVHRDETVAEAVACQLTVLDYAPESVASRDIAALAERMHESLTLG